MYVDKHGGGIEREGKRIEFYVNESIHSYMKPAFFYIVGLVIISSYLQGLKKINFLPSGGGARL